MPVVHKKSYTAHEAISLMESISISDQESTSSSDDEDSDEETAHRNAFIVLQPPLERPDAVTDEDSDYEDAGDADRLPRRILNADAEISRKSFRENTKLPAETVFKITNSYRKKPSGSTGTSTSQPSNSAKSTDQILPGKQTSSTTSVQLKSDYQGPYWRAEEQICVITGTQLSTENQELSGKKLSGSTAQPSHSAKSTDQILPGKQTYSSTTSVQLKSDYQGPSVRRSTRSTSVSSSDSVVKIKQTPDLGSKRLPESSSASSSVQRTPHTPAASLRRSKRLPSLPEPSSASSSVQRTPRTPAASLRRSKRLPSLPESSSASSSVQKTTHTPGPTKTLKQGRKLALQTPSGEKQSSKSKSKKVDDSAIPKGYKLKETIKSTVPCYVKSDSHGNCICNYPLRSCTDELSHDEGFSDPMKCFDFSRGFKHEIVCESEMRAFIGIIINSMYMKASDRSYYWSRDRDTGIAGVRDLMSRNRFDELIKCVHFRDNREMPADNTDKFFKVRPLFQILNQKLEVFQNCENISVDESMVPYFGFHGAKQYMKGKPHKFGFKVWVATSPTGVPLFCEPYAGASTDMPDYGMKKSSDIVAHIITRLGLGAGHKVYADNYFMSPALLKWCTEKNIGLTGTLRKNRLRDVPYPPVEAAVGSYKSVVDTENNIIYTAWQDRKCVLAASNCFSCEPLRTVTVGRGQTKEKSKPDLIVEYNANMGGVDLLDFWLSVYRPRIRSRKWYWPLFTWVLGVLLVSAWKLWSNHSAAEKNENKMSFLSYIRKVNYGIRQGFPEKEHHHQPRDLLTGRIDNRFSDNAHLIDEDKDKQFVCRSCRELEGKKSRTQFFCTICRVGLHPRCFRR